MTHGERGKVKTPIDTSPAKCYPHAPLLECNLCERRRFGNPKEAKDRVEVVIDASAINRKGACGMWMGVPVVRHFAELEAA